MNSAEAETIRPTGHDYMFGGAGLCAGGTGLRARLKKSSRKPDFIGLSGIQTKTILSVFGS